GGTIFELSPSQVPTTTSLVSDNPSGSIYGQTVTYTATVTPSSGSSVPTGSVQFQIDSSNFGLPVTLVGGSASIPATLDAGIHSVVAIYTSDSANFTDSKSPPLSQIVSKADQIISWSNPANIIYGTAVSNTQLNATVTVVGPAPAGALSY